MKMSWNYRVIKRTYEDGTVIFAIHEVYYNDNGDPYMVTAVPSEPQGETLEELKDDFDCYQRPLAEPTLNYEDLVVGENGRLCSPLGRMGRGWMLGKR